MTIELPDGARPSAARRPGSVRIAERVVAKIAAGAAADVENVSAPPPRVAATRLRAWAGRPAPARLPGRQRPEGWPQARAKIVDGAVCVSLTLSVTYPASVSRTAEAVRVQVCERVAALAGLPVARIDIDVATLCGGAGAHR